MKPKGEYEIKAAAPFTLPPLPFSQSALEPTISEKTISFHYGKHHEKYVTTTNELIKGTEFEKSSLERIIKETANKSEYQKLFNNAAQSWNHWFYWNCIAPDGGGMPQGEIRKAIDQSFGNYDTFVKEFAGEAIAQFGSGWAWLVKDNGKLVILKTPNAINPIAKNQKPLLTIDLWEHAYYLDYQNKRQDYVMAVIKNCLNWEFAEYNLMND